MAFFYALRYDVAATCLTPLRTGNAEGDADMILCRSDGTAILQASSLAGALRSWLDAHDPAAGRNLFGTQEREGRIILSDGVFSGDTAQRSRPRLRIDGHTGSAVDGAKFDVVAAGVGSRFDFTLIWTGNEGEQQGAEKHIEAMLGAVHGGLILFGAQKANGFGRVRLDVKKRQFKLTDKNDREAWLDQDLAVTPCILPEIKEDQYVVFTVEATTSAILTKSSAPTHFAKGSVTENLYEGATPILTGASVKGAIRSRVESIAEKFLLPGEYVSSIFGRGADRSMEDNGIAGRARFSDVELTPPEKPVSISRTRLNRFTGSVMNKGLFSEAPLCSGLEIKIAVPKDEPAACALILFALRDLGLGLYSLGSGSAIGRGYLDVRRITAAIPGKDGTEQVELCFKQGAELSSGISTARSWIRALGGQAYEN